MTVGGRPGRRRRAPRYIVASALWNAGGLATGLAWPRLWPAVVSALAVNHISLVAGGLAPRASLLGRNLNRLPAQAARRGLVALTFDDGPDPEATPAVLEVLEKESVRASFFCVGERALEHRGLVRAMVAAGHRVENHTFRHPRHFFFLGPGAMAREVDRAQSALIEITGRPPRFFRAPAGIRNPLLEFALAARDLMLVSWTCRGYDTTGRSRDEVLNRLTEKLGAGDIIVLHDRRSRRNPRPVALDVLPALLAEIRARGLLAAPIPDDAQ